jgi:fructokinase
VAVALSGPAPVHRVRSDELVIIAIGEILFDVFPNYRRLGGAPFNFAYHLKNFGLPVRFITRVGRDAEGEEIRNLLHDRGFDLGDVQVDDRHPTGRVQVELDDNGVPEFDIIADVAYDYIQPTDSLHTALQGDVDLIYFGTLIQRTPVGFRTLQEVLSQKRRRTRGLYDINIRPKCYSKSIILNSLIQTDLVKLNLEELELIRSMLNYTRRPEDFVGHLMEAYALKLLSLTKGEDGSELFTPTGHYRVPASQPRKIADTVGAGDAFAAVLAAGYLEMWPPEKILQRAADFAARICEIQGAIPSQASFYANGIDKGARDER